MLLTAIPVFTLISESVLSDDLPERSGKQTVSFSKLKNQTTAVVIKREINQCDFLARLRLQLLSSHNWTTHFLPSHPSSQVPKNMFWCFLFGWLVVLHF